MSYFSLSVCVLFLLIAFSEWVVYEAIEVANDLRMEVFICQDFPIYVLSFTLCLRKTCCSFFRLLFVILCAAFNPLEGFIQLLRNGVLLSSFMLIHPVENSTVFRYLET